MTVTLSHNTNFQCSQCQFELYEQVLFTESPLMGILYTSPKMMFKHYWY